MYGAGTATLVPRPTAGAGVLTGAGAIGGAGTFNSFASILGGAGSLRANATVAAIGNHGGTGKPLARFNDILT